MMPPPTTSAARTLAEGISGICAIAGAHAADVDRHARFPAETFDALRTARLMDLLVPIENGGPGGTLREAGAICHALGQRCSASGMIYAMHAIQLACIVNHTGTNRWYLDFQHRVVDEQLLLASVTSEVGTGGRMNDSICALDYEGRGAAIALEKQAPSISYGRAADALLITTRRMASSAGNDQVLVTAGPGDYTLTKTSDWDSLGMRGTCTEGFVMRMTGSAEQVLPAPFHQIMAETMVPVSHLLWGCLWLGIARDATERAQRYLRESAGKTQKPLGSAGRRLSRCFAMLKSMDQLLDGAFDTYATLRANAASGLWQDGPPMHFAAEFNNLKTTVSETCLAVVHEAFPIVGINGYRNDSPFSLGRHLRDLMSAPLMINNDRISENSAAIFLMQRSFPFKVGL